MNNILLPESCSMLISLPNLHGTLTKRNGFLANVEPVMEDWFTFLQMLVKNSMLDWCSLIQKIYEALMTFNALMEFFTLQLEKPVLQEVFSTMTVNGS